MTKFAFFIWMLLPLSANAGTGSIERPAAGRIAATLNCFQRRPFLQMTMKWDESGGFHLALLSQEGIDGMPLFNGIVTSYNLNFLRLQKEDLKDWPALVSLSWAPGECKKSDTDPWVVECSGPGVPDDPSAWPYATSTFFAYRRTQIGVGGESGSRAMTWAVESQGNTYFLGFNFMSNMCE